jgi:hypothetical protein
MATFTVSTAVSYTYTTGSPVAITITSGTIAAALTAMSLTGFPAQVQEALTIVALAVLAVEDPTVPYAHARARYSRLVLAIPGGLLPSAQYAITSDGVTGPSSTDQVFVDRVLAIYDQLSASPSI